MNFDNLPDRQDDSEKGAALILVMFMILVLTATTTLLLASVRSQSQSGVTKTWASQAYRLADVGLAKSIVQVRQDPSLYDGAAGTVIINNVDGATVTITHLEGSGAPYWTHQFRASATVNNELRVREAVVRFGQNSVTVPTAAPGMGAIVANGDLSTGGSLIIDGRDHSPEGVLGGQGFNTPGVVTTGTVDRGGNSKIGGMDEAPSKTPTDDDGVTGALDNGSFVWEPEGTGTGGTGNAADDSDGVDTDGDGFIDENGFPNRPAGFFPGHSDESAFIQQAKNDNTYFQTKAEYNAWVASTANDAERGGKIIYIEIDNSQGPVDIGQIDLPHNAAANGASPSMIFIVGTDTTSHNITSGPIHINNGQFQGLVVTDTVNKFNGNGTVVGSVIAFNPSDASHFGNGTADLLFSSEVMGNLPGTTTNPSGGSWKTEFLSQREVR